MHDIHRPPQMTDSPEKVIAWGEYLDSLWAAATPGTGEEERRWRALSDFYASWGRGLLKFARQSLVVADERQRYEAELTAAAQALQKALSIGQVKHIGLLEVAEGVLCLAAINASLIAAQRHNEEIIEEVVVPLAHALAVARDQLQRYRHPDPKGTITTIRDAQELRDQFMRFYPPPISPKEW